MFAISHSEFDGLQTPSSIFDENVEKTSLSQVASPYSLYPPPPTTIVCSKGFWIYTKTGGVLEVYPAVNTIVRKGDLIARIKNIFGNIVDEIFSPSRGLVSKI
jgi:hypothetical protein